jgi:hypothetical protein
MRHETFAIGCAAGFGGDRTDAAAPIVETLMACGGLLQKFFGIERAD